VEETALLLGPVFRFEMNARARRKGTFVVRGAYGLLLLLVFSIPLYDMPGLSKAGELSFRELPRVAEAFLASIMALQALTIVSLTPALVAGTLARERESGRLELLAASPLSAAEIILGSLFAGLYELVIIVALAVPVLCILSLLGGLDVGIIVLSDGLLLTTGFLVAATAIVVSSLSERPRRAIFGAYLIVAGWTALPLLIMLARSFGPAHQLARSAWPIEDAIRFSNPLYVFFDTRGLGRPALGQQLLSSMSAHLTIGVLLILTASAILRPSLRRSGPFGWRWAPLIFLLSKRSLLPRSSCGDYPMVWKECNLARTSILLRVMTVTAVLAIAMPLASITWYYTAPAFEELRLNGYGAMGVTTAREQLNGFLRMAMVCLYILLALGLAIRSATSITSEKEKSTWTSLLASPMEAGEILAGKLCGAFRGIWWLGLAFGSYLALGLILGSIHPLAGCFSVVLIAALLGTVGGLGLLFSMISRSSTRALTATMLTLLAVNTVPMFCGSGGRDLPLSLACLSPLLIGLSLASFDDLDHISRGADTFRSEALALLVCGLILYVAAAWALWKACVGHFDVAVDRPRSDPWSRRSPPDIKPAESPADVVHDSPSGAGGTSPSEVSSPDVREA
jgi:ABC-type transport system involved in multi-copper enzyme maturation permease subunit